MPEQIEQISKDSVAFKRQAKLAALDASIKLASGRGTVKASDIVNPAEILYKWLIKDLTNKTKEQEDEEIEQSN